MILAKYAFKEVPDLSNIKGDVVEHGYLVEFQGDEDNPPIISDLKGVDVLYHSKEVDISLEPWRVYPTSPSFTIFGMDEYYQNT